MIVMVTAAVGVYCECPHSRRGEEIMTGNNGINSSPICSRTYSNGGAFTARIDKNGYAICVACGHFISAHQTQVIGTDDSLTTN